jgi:hypothetical protein
MYDYHSAWDADRDARRAFLYVQLELARSYCRLAERSDLAHLPHHLKNARRTYDNVLRHILDADLEGEEFCDITSDAELLKCRLAALDERSNDDT